MENGANVWPDDVAEAAFLAEQGASAPPPKKPAAPKAEDDEAVAKIPLPDLDALIKRLPAETRELVDELFRAKFTKVTRVPKAALKE